MINTADVFLYKYSRFAMLDIYIEYDTRISCPHLVEISHSDHILVRDFTQICPGKVIQRHYHFGNNIFSVNIIGFILLFVDMK